MLRSSRFKKSQFRSYKRKFSRKYPQEFFTIVKQSSLHNNHFHQLLFDLKISNANLLTYTIIELEPICQQIASKKMSSSMQSIITCPWICLFCENLIYEPITLYCGHTYCTSCIKDEEFSSISIHCLRCSNNIPSSIIYAREINFNKNHFLKQILERSKTLKLKCQNISLCHQADNYYINQNYQQAIEIYSNILDNHDNDDADNHIVLYGRAKTYLALKQLIKALDDIEQVILLKPYWRKGYYCRSEIFFEMKMFNAALLSSLQGLAFDPEDQYGKQIMARHLHAVLHDTDNDKEQNIQTDSNTSSISNNNNNTKHKITSDTNNTKLLLCRSTQSNLCICTLFDYENLSIRDFECSICVNLLWFPVTTPCGHVFCRECLIRSIDNTQAQCPICKHSLNEFFSLLIQSQVDKTEIIEQLIQTCFPNEFNERYQLYQQENNQGSFIPRSPLNNADSIIFEIPIFVCVLTLPCCSCPLHVFEPRYRLMMRRTLETQSRTFGMCKYDEQTDSFSDYGTLLFIRGLMYTQDGRSIVDTIGQQRFHIIDRGTKDGYNTARVEIIRDHPIEPDEFDNLYRLNRETYNHVRIWFDQLDINMRTLISRQLEDYPPCDDLIEGSADGPSWAWIILNLLPIESDLQYAALTSQSFRTRLEMINNTIDFYLINQNKHKSLSYDKTSFPLLFSFYQKNFGACVCFHFILFFYVTRFVFQ